MTSTGERRSVEVPAWTFCAGCEKQLTPIPLPDPAPLCWDCVSAKPDPQAVLRTQGQPRFVPSFAMDFGETFLLPGALLGEAWKHYTLEFVGKVWWWNPVPASLLEEILPSGCGVNTCTGDAGGAVVVSSHHAVVMVSVTAVRVRYGDSPVTAEILWSEHQPATFSLRWSEQDIASVTRKHLDLAWEGLQLLVTTIQRGRKPGSPNYFTQEEKRKRAKEMHKLREKGVLWESIGQRYSVSSKTAQRWVAELQAEEQNPLLS